MKTMKIVLVFIAIFNYSSGFKFDSVFQTDLRAFLDGLSKGCPVAHTEGCPPEVTYWLYTRQNRKGVQLNVNDLKSAGFLDKQLKVLIHGYQNGHTSLMITSLMNGYLDYGDYNVIAVDWGFFCKAGCYVQGVTSIKPVGGCVAEVLRKAMAEKNFGNVHILGHSLGAHVASRVSGHFKNTEIDRLTRFDPALPLFSIYTTDEGRAKFRDTYHSNTGLLGQSPAQGNIDVYLNSDQFQPGCGCDLACSHMRSVLYFAESIKNGMKGFYCSDWDNFLDGKCKAPTKDTLIEIGDRADFKQNDASFKIFGKPKAPFLYAPEDYLNIDKFNKFKETGKGECVENTAEKIKDYFAGKFKND